MRILGVQLRFPNQTALLLVPFAAAGSAYLGSLIQKTTSGSVAPVAAMAAAGGVATFLILAGADFDAGWRGFALTFGASVLTFSIVLVGFAPA